MLPAIRKDINIDDDLTGLVIKDIGFLNSFVSGAGGNVERKGENISANLTMETTPKIWGASNRLPAIMGDGFKRRLCLILAENPIDINEVRKSYQTELLSGERDEEVGLLISYSIQQYIKKQGTSHSLPKTNPSKCSQSGIGNPIPQRWERSSCSSIPKTTGNI